MRKFIVYSIACSIGVVIGIMFIGHYFFSVATVDGVPLSSYPEDQVVDVIMSSAGGLELWTYFVVGNETVFRTTNSFVDWAAILFWVLISCLITAILELLFQGINIRVPSCISNINPRYIKAILSGWILWGGVLFTLSALQIVEFYGPEEFIPWLLLPPIMTTLIVLWVKAFIFSRDMYSDD